LRFKIEFLARDNRVCGWIFPAGAETLAAAVEAAQTGWRPEDAAGFRVLGGGAFASVVWGESLIDRAA
jgi:hypothetical protein